MPAPTVEYIYISPLSQNEVANFFSNPPRFSILRTTKKKKTTKKPAKKKTTKKPAKKKTTKKKKASKKK